MSAVGPVQSARSGRPVRLYRGSVGDTDLREMDPHTLTDTQVSLPLKLPAARSDDAKWFVVQSDDGSSFVTERSYLLGVGVEGTDVNSYDARSDTLRYRAHLPVAMDLFALSSSGRYAIGMTGNEYSFDARYFGVDLARGRILGKFQYQQACCFDPFHDPTARRMYFLDMPYLPADGARRSTPALMAYDTRTGHRAGHTRLSGVLAGLWSAQQAGGKQSATAYWLPGAAVSPDGRQIAILDANSNRLTLIDARDMKVVKRVGGAQSKSSREVPGQLWGAAPRVATAKPSEGITLSMLYAADGRHLYVTGRRLYLTARGESAGESLGLKLIDVKTGNVVASALSDSVISWALWPTADPSALYVLTRPWDCSTPCSFMLRRLDPLTLKVTAERPWDPGTGLYALRAPAQ